MKYFVVTILLALALLPMTSVFAADDGLVVCGREGTPKCDPCMLFKQISVVLNFITSRLVPIVATVICLVAGAMIILGGANPELVGKAKSMLTNTVIAIILIYGAYLFANTIIQTLAGDDNRANSWFQIDCKTSGLSTTGGTGGTGGTGTRTWNPPPVIPGVSMSDGDARQYLASRTDNQIRYGFRNCAENHNVDCTSLEGAKISTLNEIVRLQQQCGCSLQINDATGPGHTGGSHNIGVSFDVQRSNTLDALVHQYPLSPDHPDNLHFLAPSGAVYFEEDPGHFHVGVS